MDATAWIVIRATTAILVAIGTAGTGRVNAQEAIAALEWIDAADVNAPLACELSRGEDRPPIELPQCSESRRVCLNAGGFVLAVKTHSERIASAALTTEEEDVEDTGKIPAWMFFGLYHGNVLHAQTSTHEGWNWTTFHVAEPQCYSVTAVDGQARLYKLRVAVPW